MKQILLLLTVIAFTFSSCKKEKLQNRDLCAAPNIIDSTCIRDSNEVKSLIIGRWDWTRTIGSWGIGEYTPCTDSINLSLNFLSGGNVQYFENGELVQNCTYYFLDGPEGPGASLVVRDSTYAILSGWVLVCNNYLIVDKSSSDGPKVILVRPGE